MIAQSVTVDGTGTRLGGGVRLSSAKVGAHLLIGDGAHVAADPSTGWALDADPLSVAGDLFISGEGTRLAGGLRLNGATFGGSVAIYDGASVAAADDGWSIAADNLTVPQSLLFVQTSGSRADCACAPAESASSWGSTTPRSPERSSSRVRT
jgi:hypothetical protein